MFRRLGLALVLGLSLLIPVSAAQPGLAQTGTAGVARAAQWRPPAGAAFNNPVGGPAERSRLIHRIGDAIRHTHKGQTIRIATYSFDRHDIADLLIKAKRRGVHVQVVVNDNWTSKPTKRLRRALGHNPHKNNFVVICQGSCRGGPGNLHMKVFSFTKTGGASNVLMTGSTNITNRAANLQWNDLFTVVGNKGLFDTFVGIFNQLKLDKRVNPRWVEYHGTGMDATFYRKSAQQPSSVQSRPAPRAPAPEDDPVNKRLKRIRCAAAKGAGINGHTVVRIMMYGWQNDRG
jgi:phosphatidylserine/phosphatidylglycerophosphate/cardiolipin synthase-like enzyme